MTMLGQVVRNRRIALGLTQEELAIRIGEGTRQADISRFENSGVSLPHPKRLEQLAAVLDLPLSDLLARSGEHEGNEPVWHEGGRSGSLPSPASGSVLELALVHARQVVAALEHLVEDATGIEAGEQDQADTAG